MCHSRFSFPLADGKHGGSHGHGHRHGRGIKFLKHFWIIHVWEFICLQFTDINRNTILFEKLDYHHRKRYRDDDRHAHESSKRTSDYESRRNSNYESRPVISKRCLPWNMFESNMTFVKRFVESSFWRVILTLILH